MSPNLPTDISDEDVRTAIRTLGESIEAQPGVYDAVRRRHTRSYRRRAVAAAVALVLLAGGAVFAGPRLPAVVDQDSASVRDRIPDYGPTRGSLAGDTAFLRALPAQAKAVAQMFVAGDPRAQQEADSLDVAGAQVVFAGDIPGERRALVVTTVNTRAGVRPVHIWLNGPVGATVEQMGTVETPVGGPVLLQDRQDLPEVFTWSSPLSDTRRNLVVVAPRGAQVEVSRRPVYTARGTAERAWERPPTADGVAVLDLAGVDVRGVAVRVRVDGDIRYLGQPRYSMLGVAARYSPAQDEALNALGSGSWGSVHGTVIDQSAAQWGEVFGIPFADVVDVKPLAGFGWQPDVVFGVFSARDRVGGGTLALAIQMNRPADGYAIAKAGAPVTMAWATPPDLPHGQRLFVFGPRTGEPFVSASVRSDGWSGEPWTRETTLANGVGEVESPEPIGVGPQDSPAVRQAKIAAAPVVRLHRAGVQIGGELTIAVERDRGRLFIDPPRIEAMIIPPLDGSDD